MSDDPYEAVKAHFDSREGVVVNSGRGAQGMKVGKSMFAMFYKGDLLLTMPPKRVGELISAARGEPHDPGTGKAMANRVLIPSTRAHSWIELAEEAAVAAGAPLS